MMKTSWGPLVKKFLMTSLECVLELEIIYFYLLFLSWLFFIAIFYNRKELAKLSVLMNLIP